MAGWRAADQETYPLMIMLRCPCTGFPDLAGFFFSGAAPHGFDTACRRIAPPAPLRD